MDNPTDPRPPSSRLRIVADANIPGAESAFGGLGRLVRLPGEAVSREVLCDADVLLVRSVTRVDTALVAGTPVRFVGTATAGTDHLDLAGLAARGIATASAPGSNATSVVEYVLAALLALAADRGATLSGQTLGVVGAGEVGGRLVPRARALGLEVVVCDPPRAEAGHADHAYLSLGDLLAASDIVTLHTPLTDAGRFATRGLVGREALAAMRPGAWLVNAARGGVVDGRALLDARDRLGALVLDCWPGEPAPDPALVAAANIATPHIAGYSADGKRAGTAMLAAALRTWMASEGLGAPAPWAGADVREAVVVEAPPAAESAAAWLDALQRQAYSVRADDARFRAAMAGAIPSTRAAAFSELRRTYPVRRENAAAVVRGVVPAALRQAVTDGLGMRLGA